MFSGHTFYIRCKCELHYFYCFKNRNVLYNLRREADTLLPAVRTTTYGIETSRFIDYKLSCY